MRKIVLLAGIMLAGTMPVCAQINPAFGPQQKAKYTLEKLTHYDSFAGRPLGDIAGIFTDYYEQIDLLIHDSALTPEMRQSKIILLKNLRDEKLKLKLTDIQFNTWHNEIEPVIIREKID